MPTAKIGRRGQLTLPKDVRQSLGLSEGDSVAFVESAGEVVLRPVRHTLRDLRGSVPVDGPQDRDAVRERTLGVRADSQAGAAQEFEDDADQ